MSKDCERVQRILHLLQPAWWMILMLSVAPKLAWHRDQSRCDLARNQEFSMKISFFQIPICGQPPGNFAKQNAHRTRLVRCSTGSRTKVDACILKIVKVMFKLRPDQRRPKLDKTL